MSDESRLPSVDRVARAMADVHLPHAVLVRIARSVIGELRATERTAGLEAVVALARPIVEGLARAALTSVINATGVVIHTNLGRSPLGEEAVAAIVRAAADYNTLEYDLDNGERSIRGMLVEELLATLCDCEATTLVNNCAAGLYLVLHHLTKGQRKEVVVSRGELVQIGGGFRVPEILAASGAVLREVGTTNQTTVDDYAHAITHNTALVLHVHRSNFWMEGFVGSPSLADIAQVCKKNRVLLVEDLGSGWLGQSSARKPGTSFASDPTPADTLRAGADLVCFSGDKLFGGPQAGVLAGDASLVAAMKKEPLFRALRCDKMMIAGMEATARAHLDGGATIPIVSMLNITAESLRPRAQAIAYQVGPGVSVVDAPAQVGGGSLPQITIPSVALEITPTALRADQLAHRLRTGDPAVIGYVAAGKLRLDLRAVFPRQDAALAQALRKALALP